MRTLLAILDFALVQNFDCAFDSSVLGLVAVEDAVLRRTGQITQIFKWAS
jgi:hypothetical protein